MTLLSDLVAGVPGPTGPQGEPGSTSYDAGTLAFTDEHDDTTCFVAFVTGATGQFPGKTNSNLTFNSATGVLSATGFFGPLTGNVTGNCSGSSGSCTGNAASATYASALTFASEEADTECFVAFITNSSPGNYPGKYNSNLKFNASTCVLYASGFVGPLTGDVTGDLSGNADTATLASTVTVADTTDSSCYVGLFEDATGSLGCKTDAGITYDATTGTLSSTLFNVGGRIQIAQTAAPSPTTDRLYNVSGNLFWNGTNLTGGGALPSGTEGQMLYNNAGTWTAFSGLFWDDANNRLGIGCIDPYRQLELYSSTASTLVQLLISNTYDAVGNTAGLGFFSQGVATRVPKAAIYHIRTDSYDVGDLCFAIDNANDWNAVTTAEERMRITSAGNVGIGTTAIPKGAVGMAKLAIEGINGSVNGPHIQLTTGADNYPLLQVVSWAHDTIDIAFDSYYDGGADWKSSDAGSNYLIQKYSDLFSIRYDSGIAAGAAITWNNGIVLNTSGYVGIGTAAPACLLDVGGTSVAGNIRVGNSAGSQIFEIYSNNAFPIANLYINSLGTTALVIEGSAGNVGIGVAPTLGTLHVAGSILSTTGINISGNGGFYNAANKFGIDVNGSTSRFYASGPDGTTQGSYEFHIISSDGTPDTIAMAVSNTGNLTLAGTLGLTGTRVSHGYFTDLTVTNPISGSITGNAATATLAATLTLADEHADTSCFIPFAKEATGAQALYTSTGLGWDSHNYYLGVGTAVPAGVLDVRGQDTWVNFYVNASATAPASLPGPFIAWNFSDGQGESILAYRTDTGLGTVPRLALGSFTGSTFTEALTINAGNVGIGTADPGYKLEICDATPSVLDDGNISLTATDAFAADKGGSIVFRAKYDVGGDIETVANISGKRCTAVSSDIQGYIQLCVSNTFGTMNEVVRVVGDLNGGTLGSVGIGTTTPTSLLDLQKAGTVTADVDFLEITNTANAASMTDTRTSILFNQWYYNVSTPAVSDAAKITVGTEGNWVGPDERFNDSYMAFSTVRAGTMIEWVRITSDGFVGIALTPSYRLDVADGDINLEEGYCYRYGGGILAYAQTALHNYYFGDAGNLATDGTYNTAVGDSAGAGLATSSDYNTMVGAFAGYSNTGDSLTAVGYNAAFNTTGNGNTAIGFSAGANSSTGIYNTFVGYEAGLGSGVYASADYNVCVGYHAGYILGADADNNTLIGTSAGAVLTAGSDSNVCVGASAGGSYTGSEIVAVGTSALYSTTGVGNTALGHRAGYFCSTGENNVFIGFAAAQSTATYAGAHDNIVIGSETHYNIDDGAVGNVMVGRLAGYNSSTGTYNTFVGMEAGRGVVGIYSGADYNVCVGYRAGYQFTGDANSNTLVGASAGQSITTGDYNVCIGASAGSSYTTGDSITAVGTSSLANTTGTDNTALGAASGQYCTTGAGNVFVGSAAGRGNGGVAYTNANYNTAVGYHAGYSLDDDASNNVLIGSVAGNLITTGIGNTCLGAGAGSNYTGSNIVAVGINSLGYTTGVANTGIGYQAGLNCTTGIGNVFLGYNAAAGSGGVYTGSNYNIGIGYHALYDISSTAEYNTCIGAAAGENITTGDMNVLIGHGAGAAFLTVDNLTAVGSYALLTTTGIENTALGYSAGRLNQNGTANTFIGYSAGYGIDGSAYDSSVDNVAVGAYALGYIQGSSSYNVAVGKQAGLFGTTSNTGNTFVGQQAGYGQAGAYTGSTYNVGVGYTALYSIASGAHGNSAFGRSAGYGISTGDYNVCVGNEAGYNSTTGIGNIFVGYRAGYGSGGAYTGANYNVCVGYVAGNALAASSVENVLVGSSAGTVYAGSYLTAIGASACQLTTGEGNTALGYYAGYANQTGTSNIFVGYQAARGSGAYTGSDYNVIIGYQANYYIANSADGNTIIGYTAAYNNTDGANNVVIGIQAAKGSSTYTGFNNNVVIGYRAGYVVGTNSGGNVLVGSSAGFTLADDDDGNTLIGQNAGYYYTGGYLTAIGSDCLVSTTGVGNVGLGYNAGYYNQTGTYNTFLGYEAGMSNTNVYTGSSYNVAVGYHALYDIEDSSTNNTCIGSLAGENITTGDGNVCLGYKAGSAITTGSNYLYIANSDSGAGSTLLTGDFSDGSVGIGVAAASLSAWLHIKAGTATAGEAPLKFTNASAYLGTIEEGAVEASYYHLWYSPMSAVREGLVGAVFVQTADVTVANTATATTLMGTGRGLDLNGTGFPANFFGLAGKTVRLRAWGYLSSTTSTNIKFIASILTGGGTGISLETRDVDVSSRSDLGWSAEIDITYRAGATPKMHGQGVVRISSDSSIADIAQMVELSETTVDPTAINFMEFMADWDNASASNTITCTNLTVEILD